MVRDGALAVSGLLAADVGGKSVKPYQPQGIWNPLNSFYEYPEPADVPDDEHHRRTLYTFVKRNAPHPALRIFDFTNRTESIARRRTSNTPLQALLLMNDPQYVEAYRALAERALAASVDEAERLPRLYRMATRTTPTQAHVDLLSRYYREQREMFAANGEKAVAGFDWKKPNPFFSSGVTRFRYVTSLASMNKRTWGPALCAVVPIGTSPSTTQTSASKSSPHADSGSLSGSRGPSRMPDPPW